MSSKLIKIRKPMANGLYEKASVRKRELEYYKSKGWSVYVGNKAKVSKPSDKASK